MQKVPAMDVGSNTLSGRFRFVNGWPLCTVHDNKSMLMTNYSAVTYERPYCSYSEIQGESKVESQSARL